MKRLIILIFLFSSLIYPQTSYHISMTGNDANDGSLGSPWKTVDKVYHLSKSPGDSILFKRGDTLSSGEFTGTMTGTAVAGIVVGAYGTGLKPVIYGDLTGTTWIEEPRMGTGIWKTFCGYASSMIGYENDGTWGELTNKNQGDLHFYLSDFDSLTKFLTGLTVSSFGWGNDTVWVKTFDDASPVVKIVHESNFLQGEYLTIRDINFRNWKTPMKTLYPMKYLTLDSLEITNSLSSAIYIEGKGGHNNLIVNCDIDSSNYTAIYAKYGSASIVRSCSVTNVVDNVLGLGLTGTELCGIGVQQDTGCTVENNYISNCSMSGVDTYYNVNDTVRNNTLVDCDAGIYLNGDGWITNGNNVTITGASTPGIRVDIHGTRQTKIYSNTLSVLGYGVWVATSEPGGGSVISYYNTIDGNSATTAFDAFNTSGVTITAKANVFTGTGRFTTGVYPDETIYSTLSEFRIATEYEYGSTINGSQAPNKWIYIIGASKDWFWSFGDESGWQTTFCEGGSLYGVITPVCATSGWSTHDCMDAIDARMAACTTNIPNIIILSQGHNDILQQRQMSDSVKNNYLYVIDAMHVKWPDAKMYIVHPWMRHLAMFQTSYDSCNMIVDEIIAARSSFVSHGPDERIWIEDNCNGGRYTSDGIHYSLEGKLEAAHQWHLAIDPRKYFGRMQ